MKKLYLYILLFSAALIFISCKNYVTNVDPPVNEIEDSELNNESQLPFLINGVEIQFTYACAFTNICAACLSDAFFVNQKVGTVNDGAYMGIDGGKIYLDNPDIYEAYKDVGQLRFYADDLIRRTNSISISDTLIRDKALFTGYFYGGYARYLYATFFGLNPTEGGSPINNGVFINSNQMYDSAIVSFKKSLEYTQDTLTVKSINSVIARTYLYDGDYFNANVYAENGLMEEDEAAFVAPAPLNLWNRIAGEQFQNILADSTFKRYIDIDPNEANRIKLDSIQLVTQKLDTVVIGDSTEVQYEKDTTWYYVQAVYTDNSSPLKIITWQENNLMRAELSLRGFGSGIAEDLVNEVRESHQIADLNSPVDLDVIYTERDKELFPSGNRLVDERRFNKWHLGPGTWEYLPIPQSERDGNPNIN
jgi:tetratricopeptide (TPR) repeat protein